MAGFGGSFMAPPSAPSVRVPNLAENRERDWQRPGHGEMVCHCELVTKREIEAALRSSVPPGDFGGLKRALERAWAGAKDSIVTLDWRR